MRPSRLVSWASKFAAARNSAIASAICGASSRTRGLSPDAIATASSASSCSVLTSALRRRSPQSLPSAAASSIIPPRPFFFLLGLPLFEFPKPSRIHDNPPERNKKAAELRQPRDVSVWCVFKTQVLGAVGCLSNPNRRELSSRLIPGAVFLHPTSCLKFA